MSAINEIAQALAMMVYRFDVVIWLSPFYRPGLHHPGTLPRESRQARMVQRVQDVDE
ncbi:hypothetical protein [Ruania zhangjianzhongii]|uniref:hypothetical protein n=1 Tax=Ruania zhangjianzhongii TaxID=2603206 RepID=UPI001651F1C5|nr:hypothetical protein [Ruania zhangjianzhongii]